MQEVPLMSFQYFKSDSSAALCIFAALSNSLFVLQQLLAFEYEEAAESGFYAAFRLLLLA